MSDSILILFLHTHTVYRQALELLALSCLLFSIKNKKKFFSPHQRFHFHLKIDRYNNDNDMPIVPSDRRNRVFIGGIGDRITKEGLNFMHNLE